MPYKDRETYRAFHRERMRRIYAERKAAGLTVRGKLPTRFCGALDALDLKALQDPAIREGR